MQTVTLVQGNSALSTLPSETMALLARLIAFDTASDRGNLPLIGCISDDLDGYGIPYTGIPSIVCGPGNIDQAHQGDEWIAASELAACDRFIRQTAERICR